uniref:Uncharacterized protein n=1 Tax=Plectus sambesii TaxID=2011161 RepID=A0A914UQX6_9BILA
MNATLLILAVCIGASFALDCRKFAFAPACRGIMLKRMAEESAAPDDSVRYMTMMMQVHDDLVELKTAIENATVDGKFDCKALTELKDHVVMTKKWARQFAFA